MDSDFRYRPWAEGPILSPEDFLRSVESAIAESGYWEAYGEIRMGAGPTVKVTVADGEVKTYRATATWGALTLSGDYEGLEHALFALAEFAESLLHVREAGAWQGLVGG